MKSSPARIVVIEDNAADVQLLDYALSRHGKPYELEVLMDGEEALQFVEEHRAGKRSSEPCVIVLDLHLPRYDGMAVLSAIKCEPVLAHIHVIVLSSLATPEEERQLTEMGVRLYETKPMTLEELTAVAGRILDVCGEPVAAAA